jgi:hypothetical protein
VRLNNSRNGAIQQLQALAPSAGSGQARRQVATRRLILGAFASWRAICFFFFTFRLKLFAYGGQPHSGLLP